MTSHLQDTASDGARNVTLTLDTVEAPIHGALHGAVSVQGEAPEGVRVRLLERRRGHVEKHNVVYTLDERIVPAEALRDGAQARFRLKTDTSDTSHDGKHVAVDHWVAARLLGTDAVAVVDAQLGPCAFDAERRDALVKGWRRGALVDQVSDGLLMYVVGVGLIGIPCFAIWVGMVAFGVMGVWRSVSEGGAPPGGLCTSLGVLGLALLVGLGGKDIVKDALIGVWARLRLRGGITLDSNVLCRGERGRAVLNTTLATPVHWRLRHFEESAQIDSKEVRGSTIRTKAWKRQSWWWEEREQLLESRTSEFDFTVPEDAAPHLRAEDHKIAWEVTATAKLGSYERVFTAPVYVVPMLPPDDATPSPNPAPQDA